MISYTKIKIKKQNKKKIQQTQEEKDGNVSDVHTFPHEN